MTTAYNLNDYNKWLAELKEVFRSTYSLNETTIEEYVTTANWEDYYNEDYSPAEAALEDSEYWVEIAA